MFALYTHQSVELDTDRDVPKKNMTCVFFLPSEGLVVEIEIHFVIGFNFVGGAIAIEELFYFGEDIEEIVLSRRHNLKIFIIRKLHRDFLGPRFG